MAKRDRARGVEASAGADAPFSFDVGAYPTLPKLCGLFVTGTDTGVGKTLIAGGIARVLRESGVSVEVFKPVASGCRRTREGLVSSDAEFLAACADSRRTLAEITPVRYAAPLSPNVAAQREHRPVDLKAIFEQYRRLADAADVVVVEGVGGLLCPLSDDFWVIHLARMMQLPLVVVARAGLGTINHTLLTIQVARSAGLEVAGVVVNRYRVEPPRGAAPPAEASPSQPIQATSAQPASQTGADEDLSMLTNPQQIALRGRVRVLAIAPDEPANNVVRATLGEDTLFALRQVDWRALAEGR